MPVWEEAPALEIQEPSRSRENCRLMAEGVMSGILNPDEYVLSMDTLAIKHSSVGDNELQIVRAPAGHGTMRSAVPHSLREAMSRSANNTPTRLQGT